MQFVSKVHHLTKPVTTPPFRHITLLIYISFALVQTILTATHQFANTSKLSLGPGRRVLRFGFVFDKASQDTKSGLGYAYVWRDGNIYQATLSQRNHSQLATHSLGIDETKAGRVSEIRMSRTITGADTVGVYSLTFANYSIPRGYANLTVDTYPLPNTEGSPVTNHEGKTIFSLVGGPLNKFIIFEFNFSRDYTPPANVSIYESLPVGSTAPAFKFSADPLPDMFIMANETEVYCVVKQDALKTGRIYLLPGSFVIVGMWNSYLAPEEDDRIDMFAFKDGFALYACTNTAGTIKLERLWFENRAIDVPLYSNTKSKSFTYSLGSPTILAVRRQRRYLWVLESSSVVRILNEETFALLTTINLSTLYTAVGISSVTPVDFGVLAPARNSKLEFWVAVNTNTVDGHILRADITCTGSTTPGVCSICTDTDNTCLKCGFPYILVSDVATGAVTCGENLAQGTYMIPNSELYSQCIVQDCMEFGKSFSIMNSNKNNIAISNCNDLVCTKCIGDKVPAVIFDTGSTTGKVVCLPKAYNLTFTSLDNPPERLGRMDLFFEVRPNLMDGTLFEKGYTDKVEDFLVKYSYPNSVNMWKLIAKSLVITLTSLDGNEVFPNMTVRTFPYSADLGYVGINLNEFDMLATDLNLTFRFIPILSAKIGLKESPMLQQIFVTSQNVSHLFSKDILKDRNDRIYSGYYLGLLYNHFSLSFASNMYQSAVALGIFVAFNMTSAIPVLCTLALFCCMKLLFIVHNDQMRGFFNQIRAPTMLLASLYDNADFVTSVNGTPDYTSQLYRSSSNKVTTMQIEKSAFFSLYIKGFAMIYLTYSFYLYRYKAKKNDAEQPELILYQASLMRRAESYAMKMFLPDFLLCGLYMLSNLYGENYLAFIDWAGFSVFSSICCVSPSLHRWPQHQQDLQAPPEENLGELGHPDTLLQR